MIRNRSIHPNANIDGAKLADGTVTGAKIAGEAVDSGKLGPNAVTSAKLALGAVTSGAIAAKAVTTDKVADHAIGAQQIKMFCSGALAEGTGELQTIAHNLGVLPTYVLVVPYDDATTITEGEHDDTQIKVTVTAGKHFKVLAFVY